jgi:flagellar M-ring protein FliF
MAALDAQNIPYRTSGMQIQIRENDFPEAQAQLSMVVASSQDDFTFQDALGAAGLTASARIIDESLIHAKETQIVRQLMSLDGVESAQVTLGIPENDSLWMPTQEEKTASVILTTNSLFNNSIKNNLASMVSANVVDLKRENVTILDSSGDLIFDGRISEDGQLNSQLELNAAMAAAVESKVHKNLSLPFDHLRVSANLKVDQAKVYEEVKTYSNPYDPDSATGYVAQQDTYEHEATGVEEAAEPGAVPNAAVIYPMGNGANTESSTTDTTTTYNYNELRTITDRGMTNNVLQDGSGVSVVGVRYRNYYEEAFNNGEYTDVSDAASWAVFKEEIETEIIDTPPEYLQQAILASGIDNTQILSLRMPIFNDLPPGGIRMNEVLMLAVMGLVIILLAYGLLRRQKPEEITDLEPELAVEDLLVSTQIEEEKEQEMQEDERLREIKLQQDSETKMQIERFINLRPEAAAQLLRNWLNEDWD